MPVGENNPPGRGQPEGLCFPVKVAPGQPWLRAHRPRGGINPDALHRGEIQSSDRRRKRRSRQRCARRHVPTLTDSARERTARRQ